MGILTARGLKSAGTYGAGSAGQITKARQGKDGFDI